MEFPEAQERCCGMKSCLPRSKSPAECVQMYDSTEICNVVMYCIQNAYCSWYERVRGKGRREKRWREREGVRDRGDTEREYR